MTTRTEAEDREHADGQVGVGARAALKQRVHDVVGEGERDERAGHRTHDDALDPQAQERHELAHRRHDVRVVGARLVDQSAELRVAVRSKHAEEAAAHPDDERETHAAGLHLYAWS